MGDFGGGGGMGGGGGGFGRIFEDFFGGSLFDDFGGGGRGEGPIIITPGEPGGAPF